jgi:2-polyprenyl-3-methyl-5-hydroxy-6-metoxy-1,4-benzoquinol methylase
MNDNLYENYTSTSVKTKDFEYFTAWSLKWFKKNIQVHLPQNKKAAILEIGCGYGRHTLALKNAGYDNTIGIDISAEQIKYAKEIMKLDNVLHIDAMDFLEKNTTKYDVILLIDVLEHLELDYSIKLLREIKKTLKPNAVFILQVPNGICLFSPNYYNDITHYRAYSTKSIEQHLKMAGFQEEVKHYENAPLRSGFKSFIRNVLFNILLKPLLTAYSYILFGSNAGGIYTDNIISVVKMEK